MNNRQALILAIIVVVILLLGGARYLTRERRDAPSAATPTPAAGAPATK